MMKISDKLMNGEPNRISCYLLELSTHIHDAIMQHNINYDSLPMRIDIMVLVVR